jgi:hypothetical protein
MDGSESGNGHLDESSRIFLKGLDFEYPSSDESDDKSLNGSESESLRQSNKKGKKPLQKSLPVKIRLSTA